MSKGLIFSLDIFIGISLLLIVLISSFYLFSISQTYEERGYEQQKFVANDFLNSLAELKVSEAENQSETIKNLISNGNLTDDEQELSVLNLILSYWAQYKDENNTLKKQIAENITKEMVNSVKILEDINLSLSVGDDLIVGNYTNISNSIIVSSLIENTYSSTEPKYGYMARAYLNEIKTERASYLYFGGFVGQGNLTFNLYIPENAENITSAYLEVSSGSNFSLFVNNNFSGNFSVNPTAGNFSANIKSSVNISNFKKGNNTLKIVFSPVNLTEQYFGGGFLKVNYNTTEFFEEKEAGKQRYYFPEIEGIINLYDGFYIPGELNNISTYLHYYNNITNGIVYLNIANSTIFESNETGEVNITLNNSNISSSITNAGLSYYNLSKTTIPLRLGMKSTTFAEQEVGNADVVLITDVSGSMAQCVDSNDDCSSGNQRIDLAKQLDKEFVGIILNSTGNRIALVSFNSGISNYTSLTNDSAYLNSTIDDYTAGGGTCLCCAENKAYEILNSESNSSRQKFVIVMTDGIPSHKCTSSGCEGTSSSGSFEEDCYGCTYCCPADPNTGAGCDCPTSQSCGYCGCYSLSHWLCHWHPTCCENVCSCTCNWCCQQSCNCGCEIQNANFSSCRLHNNLNTTVYSIGFGPVANCQMGNTTLTAIADCGGGDYYASQNASELEEIYRNIAQSIVSISYTTQKVSIEGNVSIAGSLLFNDSYIEFNYNETKPEFGYGEFSLSFENNCTDGTCNLIKKNETEILEAKVTSYSGDYWTNLIVLTNSSAENLTIYNLSKYGKYEKLGDPFMISIQKEKISNGTNTISIFLGINETDRIPVSNDSKLIYSLKVPGYVGYGSVFDTLEEAEEDARNRLEEKIFNLTGQTISILGVNTNTNTIHGIRTLSNTSLVKLIYSKE